MTATSDLSSVGEPQGPPPRRLRVGEARTPLQLLRLVAATPSLRHAPRGDGGLVLDLPGWKAPESSNLLMRTWLRRLGHDARPWGLGTNRGTVEQDAERLADRLRATPDQAPVALVGWSLGGTIAREVARAVPDRVSRVITYGSPVVGGPTHTLGAGAFGPEECARITELARRLDAEEPLRVPVTAIYTRRDGVVDWRACIDRSAADVTHVEVRSTHLGLGLDPDVWAAIAAALATPRPEDVP
ncbi:esterase/lipase family protein [Nocardioides rubriscoriae]|uniref:esterase/lipase family protein n=1 Tax=Nocardioides rubriscoriae TaxID=642762 RepID=UPI0011E017A2|nr:alpha/beta fold hydrolase [Nocardioides rubriscoriae]